MGNRLSQCERADKREDTTYNPLVSIISAVLNGVKDLEACIKSVLSQSYTDIEHIFCLPFQFQNLGSQIVYYAPEESF